ncbi:BA75_00774T0 [Komagataella pastoris]|uniref:BA75_00774T0 n=1 Tax=Komagataella pastoris TaxID=4922 RepID=A0A1B2J8D8_PICPA|nr:BA75_00774T0 [Komagataella pastoris]
MAKTPRKNHTHGGKNLESFKATAARTKGQGRGKGKGMLPGKGKIGGKGKKNYTAERKFSLESEEETSDSSSSLSDVSDNNSRYDLASNFHNVPVFDSTDESDNSSDSDEHSSQSEEKDEGYWKATNAEVNAILGSSSSDSSSDDSSSSDGELDYVQLTKEHKARKNVNKNALSKSTENEYNMPDITKSKHTKTTKSASSTKIDRHNLSDEDLGEEVKPTSKQSNQTEQLEKFVDEPFTIEVPKFKEDEINSDNDYGFEEAKLIRTLQNDNDDLELRVRHTAVDNNDEDGTTGEDDDEKDSYVFLDEDYLLKEEADAILKDYENYSFPRSPTLKDIDTIQPRRASFFGKQSDELVLLYEPSNERKNPNQGNSRDVFESDEFQEVFDNSDDSKENDSHSYQNDDDYEDDPGFDYNDFNRSGDEDDENEQETRFDDPYYVDFPFSSRNSIQAAVERGSDQEQDSDDDSYLFNYFFKGEGDDSSSDAIASDDDELEDDQKLDDNESSNSTDEDEALPKTSNKKIGTKIAKEVLASSKVDPIPPVIGIWTTSDGGKPFEIIDGFSMRSVSENKNNIKSKRAEPSVKGTIRDRTKPKGKQTGSVPLLDLDDLLNISESDSESKALANTQLNIVTQSNQSAPNAGWAFIASSINPSNVPLSAFRNKGMVVEKDTNHLRRYSSSLQHFNSTTRRLSMAKDDRGLKAGHSLIPKKGKKKNKVLEQEVVMAPVKSLRFKTGSKKKSKKSGLSVETDVSKKRIRRQSLAEAAAEGLVPTRGGLFNEDTLIEVEALYADIGKIDELSALLGIDR